MLRWRLLSKNSGHVWLAAAVLLLMFGLALSTATQKSPTFDEQGFIVRGLGYLRAENRHMRVGHPLGLNALNATFLVHDANVRLPMQHPSWLETSFHRPAELFLWEIGNNVARIMFLARLPTVWLGMLLAAVAGRWAWQMSGRRWASLLALSLVALDPNILAHTSLATTDLGLAAAGTLAGYTLWRFLKRPSWQAAVLAGAAFGLLQNTKFTALLFLPLFGLLILFHFAVHTIRFSSSHGSPIQQSSVALHAPCFTLHVSRSTFHSPLIMLLVAYPLAAFLTLWAAYGFQVGTLPDSLPTLSQLGGRTLPLAHHLEQLLDIGGRLQQGTPAFLLGQYSDSGWWYYFPVAFLLKTPLPTLILLLWATLVVSRVVVSRIVDNRIITDLAYLLIPAVGYFAIALTTDINLGYRHLLPVLPFLYVFAAVAVSGWPSAASHQPAAVNHSPSTFHFPLSTFLITWLLLNTLLIHPHFLAFFNALAGGPDDGWRYLVDSNVDWGQDLNGLKAWMDENGVEHVWLSYFGEGRPEYYGINYTGLDSFPPRLMNPQARPFYPYNPAPGLYAISATTLQGVHFANHHQFAWFRVKTPIARIGYSIFIYEAPAYGEPAELALSGVQMDEIDVIDFARLQTNDVTPHWFNADQSLLLAPGSNSWLALGHGVVVHPNWTADLSRWFATVATTDRYALYRRQTVNAAPFKPWAHLSDGAGEIMLADVVMPLEAAHPGTTLSLTTVWQQLGPPRPVKMFIHVTGPDNSLVTQWDGLGAAWEGWRAGDILYQLHELPLSEDTPPGPYHLWAGLYHPDALERWQVTGSGTRTDGDRVYLGQFLVAGGE